MIKASRKEAEIKPKDKAKKKVSIKLIAKLHSVLNARLYKVPEVFLEMSIVAQYFDFITNTHKAILECL